MSFQPTKPTMQSNAVDCRNNQNSRHVRFNSERNQIYSIEPLFDYANDIWWKMSELDQQYDEQQQEQIMTKMEKSVHLF